MISLFQTWSVTPSSKTSQTTLTQYQAWDAT